MHKKLFFLAAAFACSAIPLLAQSAPIVIDKESEPVCAGRFLDILKASSGTLPFDYVRYQKFEGLLNAE